MYRYLKGAFQTSGSLYCSSGPGRAAMSSKKKKSSAASSSLSSVPSPASGAAVTPGKTPYVPAAPHGAPCVPAAPHGAPPACLLARAEPGKRRASGDGDLLDFAHAAVMVSRAVDRHAPSCTLRFTSLAHAAALRAFPTFFLECAVSCWCVWVAVAARQRTSVSVVFWSGRAGPP